MISKVTPPFNKGDPIIKVVRPLVEKQNVFYFTRLPIKISFNCSTLLTI